MNWISHLILKAKKMAKSKRNLQFFTLVLLCICSIMAYSTYEEYKQFNFGVFVVLGLAIALLHALHKIHWLYVSWMVIAQIFGELVSITILSIIFYLILTPIGRLKSLLSINSDNKWRSKNKFGNFEEMY